VFVAEHQLDLAKGLDISTLEHEPSCLFQPVFLLRQRSSQKLHAASLQQTSSLGLHGERGIGNVEHFKVRVSGLLLFEHLNYIQKFWSSFLNQEKVQYCFESLYVF